MKRFRPWVTRVAIGFVILAIILAVAGVWFVQRPWPEVNGTISAPGLTVPVKIIRDKWGVPHIYAQNEHDLFFAQGYVHAQDRLWQMEISRHAGNGALSELFGKATVEADRYLRIVGLRSAAEKMWTNLSPGARDILEAYTQGVNAYIDTHGDRLPLGFTLLGVKPANDVQTRALAELESWDLRLETNRVGGAIYEAWFWNLVNDTIGDELGSDLMNTYLAGGYQRHSSQVAPLMINLISNPQNKLWDDKNTPAVETPDDILKRSLQEALDYLSKQCGGNMNGWQWGCVHTVALRHQAFNTVPVLSLFFNSPTLPARGDRFTVDAAAFNASQPFQMVHGSSQRLIVDLSDLKNSLSILTTGQSGQVLNPHREDMFQMWQNVEYAPLAFSPDTVQSNAEAALVLTP